MTDDVRQQGSTAHHDVDRALRELLEEIRIAQMGGQILLGFLLAVAYTPVLPSAGDGDRALYAVAVAVTTLAVVLLLAPVPLHRGLFGRRARPWVLAVGHVLALAGVAALAASVVLSVWLAGRIGVPTYGGCLLALALGSVVLLWLALPLTLRLLLSVRRG